MQTSSTFGWFVWIWGFGKGFWGIFLVVGVGWLVGFLVGLFFFFFPALTFRMKMSKLLGAVLEAGNRYSLIYF